MAQNMSMLRSAAVSETWQTRCNRQTVLNCCRWLHQTVAGGVDRNNNTPTDHASSSLLHTCCALALLRLLGFNGGPDPLQHCKGQGASPSHRCVPLLEPAAISYPQIGSAACAAIIEHGEQGSPIDRAMKIEGQKTKRKARVRTEVL